MKVFEIDIYVIKKVFEYQKYLKDLDSTVSHRCCRLLNDDETRLQVRTVTQCLSAKWFRFIA